jgi:hypothetical protein
MLTDSGGKYSKDDQNLARQAIADYTRSRLVWDFRPDTMRLWAPAAQAGRCFFLAFPASTLSDHHGTLGILFNS